MSRRPEPCGLMALPSEVLAMVLARVPLLDLSNVRQVCRRLRQLVDGSSSKQLWASISLEGVTVDTQHLALIQRAAGCGNREAQIKLAMAFLYNQGVPKGTGDGTLESWNGLQATEYLFQLDQLCPVVCPLSWLLIRPPWSNSVSNKVCVYHKMVERCLGQLDGVIPGLFYSLGQIAHFLEVDGKETKAGQTSMDWFERGSSHSCSFSALEVWRHTHKPNLATREIQVLRSLRKIVSTSNGASSFDAKLELCTAYAGGHYSNVGREAAFGAIRELMASAQPALSQKIFRVQRDITNIMRYITVDWMVEIAELKDLPPHTLHQAVTLFDCYLMARQVDRSSLQLLGVTAILVASRWSGVTMLTIRESSWLTENTYSYEEVVKMMAELLGAFQGDIRISTICDYLDILLTLCGARDTVRSMAYYLSECVLLHPQFSRFSSAHLAASCLLNAYILLKQDYPWPMYMEQATGFTLSSLRKCCLMIYHRCLTKEFAVADNRGVELCATASRYSHQNHQCVGKREVMSMDELSEQLGISSESLDYSSTPKPKSKVKDKLLSFLSDSCYLSSPLWLSGSDSESESELEYADEDERECSASGSSFTNSLSSSSSTSFCSLPSSTGGLASQHSSPRINLQQRAFPPPSPLPPPPPSPLPPPPPPPLPPHSTPHLSLSPQHHLSGTNLSPTQSLSAPLVPAAYFSRECPTTTSLTHLHTPAEDPSSSLTRHQSLNGCDLHCSGLSGLSEKDRAHVSCPDFYSCSTDMDLGSTSQEDGNEMDIHDPASANGELERETMHEEGGTVADLMDFDFNLPPLGDPQLPNLSQAPQHKLNLPQEKLPPLPTISDNFSTTGDRMRQPRSQSSQLKKKWQSSVRNPLQPLHNTPSVHKRHTTKQVSQGELQNVQPVDRSKS